jgi:ribosome-associated protein
MTKSRSVSARPSSSRPSKSKSSTARPKKPRKAGTRKAPAKPARPRAARASTTRPKRAAAPKAVQQPAAPSAPDPRVLQVVTAAQDTKAEDIVVFDMQQRSPLCDYVLICSGRSQAHVRGIGERIETELRLAGVRCRAREGQQEGSWVLLDYDVVIVHVFHPETRTFYDLESLLAGYPSRRFASAPQSTDDSTTAA